MSVITAIAKAETNAERITAALIIALSFTLRMLRDFVIKNFVTKDFIVRDSVVRNFIAKNFIVTEFLIMKSLIMKFMISSLTETLFRK